MDKGLFRQKSIERISSPEQLHDYMRVTSPKLWMILGAILALLAGFIVYASMTTMENTMPIKVMVEHYEVPETDEETGEVAAEGRQEDYAFVYADLPMAYQDQVKPGMVVRIGEEEGRINLITTMEETDTVSLFINMEHEYIPLKDGEYDATLVLEKTTPISFLWN